jgi:5S rRNA maturation endonuclease (ribonuclease M5)
MASCSPSHFLSEDVNRESKEIIVLIDWDERGEEMAFQIEQHLRCSGSKGDVEISLD